MFGGFLYVFQKTIYYSTSRKVPTIASGIKNQLKRKPSEDKISEVLVFPPKNGARMKTVKTRKLRKEVAKITHPGVDGSKSVVWKESGLIIPPVPPSFLEGCNIIDIRYFLKVILIVFREIVLIEMLKKNHFNHSYYLLIVGRRNHWSLVQPWNPHWDNYWNGAIATAECGAQLSPRHPFHPAH